MFSFALGTGTHNSSGHWLEVFYPRPLLNPSAALVTQVCQILSCSKSTQAIPLQQDQLLRLAEGLRSIDTEQAQLCQQLAASKKPRVLMLLADDEKPATVPEVYLKLQLLSHRLARPHQLNLEGLFGLLPNVAWTSAGVFINAHSDLGGGCSILGTLSGGGKTVISVGKNCLIGANAGLGIPLGDRCTIEAGLYVTAGTKVTVLDNSGKEVQVCKARDLSGKDDLLFRRNSISGRVECLTNKTEIELNAALHSHN